MAEMPQMKRVISDGLKSGKGRPAARMTDLAGHGGMVAFGTPMVIIGGMVAARLGDPIECKAHGAGNITMGSVTVIIAGACAARMGDPTACCAPGVSGQGAAPVAGGPGSFDGPEHDSSGSYDNEEGAKRTDKVSGGKVKNKFEIFGIEVETVDELFSGKSDAHYSKDGGGGSADAEGAAHTKTTTIKTKDSSDPSIKITEKEGSGSLKGETLFGKKDGKTGIGGGFSAQASAGEKQVDTDFGERTIPFTDITIRTKSTGGFSYGAGQAANAGAYHDEADDRYHFTVMADVKALLGVKAGFDFSVGKKGVPSSGSPGAGAAGLAGTITSGCMNVLIGG